MTSPTAGFALASLLIAALSGPALAADPGENRRLVRVAVADFEATEIDPAVAALVADSVVAELRKLEHLSVIGMREIRDMLDLEAEKQALGCDDEQSCLAEIAGALGVDVLVTGSLARVGDGSLLGMRRIDQREAKVTGTFSERLPAAGGDEFLAAIGPAVEQLFPEHPLKAGQTRGVSDELMKRLRPPPIPVWGFWTLAGATAVAASAALTTASWWTFAYLSHADLGERSRASEQSGQAFKALEQQIAVSAVAFYVTGGIAAALAASTTAALFLTDFEGYGEEAE